MSVHGHLLESLVMTGLTLGGPFAMIAGFRSLRVQRLIQDTPTARIRSMAMGLVEVNGRVAGRSRVRAPFSGRPCVYWEIEIATRSANRRNNTRRWTTVHRNRSGHPFYLTDDTGTALVYPQGADCRIDFGVCEETHGFGVPDPYREYMEQQGLGMRHLWSMGPMRFRERVLEDGMGVYVLGRAVPKAQSTVISWDEDAEQATGTDSSTGSHAAPEPDRVTRTDAQVHGVIRRGTQDPAFLISMRSEKSMTLEYGIRGWAGLLAGPAMSLFGVWCLLELAKSNQLFR